MAVNHKVMELLDKIGITNARVGDKTPLTSLEEIQTEVIKTGLSVLRTQYGTGPMGPIEGYKGHVLYIFTPEGSLAVALESRANGTLRRTSNTGGLEPKPDGY
jgi:hypothetical protein